MHKNGTRGQQDGSAGQGACHLAEDQSSIPRTCMVEGGNWFQQVIHDRYTYLPTYPPPHIYIRMHKHTHARMHAKIHKLKCKI